MTDAKFTVRGVQLEVNRDTTGYAPEGMRWLATDVNYDGPGSPYGTGATPEEAVLDYFWSVSVEEVTLDEIKGGRSG